MNIANREETEVTAAHFNIGMRRSGYYAVTHGRKPAPTLFGGVEAPVVEKVAAQRVADVVRGECETFNVHDHLARSWVGSSAANVYAEIANIVAINF